MYYPSLHRTSLIQAHISVELNHISHSSAGFNLLQYNYACYHPPTNPQTHQHTSPHTTAPLPGRTIDKGRLQSLPGRTIDEGRLQGAEVVGPQPVDGGHHCRGEGLLQQQTGALLPDEFRVSAPLRRRAQEAVHGRAGGQVRCAATRVLTHVVKLRTGGEGDRGVTGSIL